MQVMGLRATYPGPNLSKHAQQHAVYPYLLRGLTIVQPNQMWGVDITYIRLHSGWMYLFAVMSRSRSIWAMLRLPSAVIASTSRLNSSLYFLYPIARSLHSV